MGEDDAVYIYHTATLRCSGCLQNTSFQENDFGLFLTGAWCLRNTACSLVVLGMHRRPREGAGDAEPEEDAQPLPEPQPLRIWVTWN